MSFSAVEREISFRFLPLDFSAALELAEACLSGFDRLSGFALSGLAVSLGGLRSRPPDVIVDDEAAVGFADSEITTFFSPSSRWKPSSCRFSSSEAPSADVPSRATHVTRALYAMR